MENNSGAAIFWLGVIAIYFWRKDVKKKRLKRRNLCRPVIQSKSWPFAAGRVLGRFTRSLLNLIHADSI